MVIIKIENNIVNIIFLIVSIYFLFRKRTWDAKMQDGRLLPAAAQPAACSGPGMRGGQLPKIRPLCIRQRGRSLGQQGEGRGLP